MTAFLREELVSVPFGPVVLATTGQAIPVQVTDDPGWAGELRGLAVERTAGANATTWKPSVWDDVGLNGDDQVYQAGAAVAPGTGFSARDLVRVLTVDATGRIYVVPDVDQAGDTVQGRVLLLRRR